jgi:glutathione peroxidase-family protein
MPPKNKEIAMTNFHSFSMQSIDGDAVDLSQYKDKVCLIVNVASA